MHFMMAAVLFYAKSGGGEPQHIVQYCTAERPPSPGDD